VARDKRARSRAEQSIRRRRSYDESGLIVEQKEIPVRLHRALAVTALTGALLVVPAAPALAFHHVVLPAVDCAAAAAGSHPGGTAPAVGLHNPVFEPPLPPAPDGPTAEPRC
jgi:hypothetical protein